MNLKMGWIYQIYSSFLRLKDAYGGETPVPWKSPTGDSCNTLWLAGWYIGHKGEYCVESNYFGAFKNSITISKLK